VFAVIFLSVESLRLSVKWYKKPKNWESRKKAVFFCQVFYCVPAPAVLLFDCVPGWYFLAAIFWRGGGVATIIKKRTPLTSASKKRIHDFHDFIFL
jgi:hypothetical protein